MGDETLEILMQGSLDTGDTAIESIRKEIQTIQGKLKDEKLTIDAKLGKDGNSDEFLKNIKLATEELQKAVQGVNFEKLSKSLKDSLNQADLFGDSLNKAREQANLLSNVSITDASKGLFTNINTYQKDLLTVEKIVTSINDKEEITSKIYEQRTDYLKIQKELYENLSSTLIKKETLERSKLKADEVSSAKLDKEIQAQQEIADSIAKSIKQHGLRNEKLEQEIASNIKLKQIQQEIREEKNKESQSNKAYKEIISLVKEEGVIAKKVVNSQGNVNSLYKERLNTIRAMRVELQAQVGSNGLTNSDRELAVKNEIKKVTNDIAVAEQRIADAENLRVAKLNDKLGSLQGISGKSENINVRNNREELEGLIRNMEIYKDSVADGTFVITSYGQAMDKNGNSQAKFTVETTNSNGEVVRQRLVVDQATQSVYKLSEQMKSAQAGTYTFTQAIMNMGKEVGKFFLMTRMGREIIQFGKQAIGFIQEIDKELTQVRIVTGMTKDQVNDLADSYSRLGDEMGKTMKEISTMNTDLIRQGLSAEESMNRMQTTLKFSATGAIEAGQALKIVTSGVNALGEDAEHLSDVLLHAGNVSASSAEEIGDSLTRVASSAKSTGVSLEETSAMIATLIEVTQESPSSLGNSLKTLMARFNRVNEETGEFNETINATQKAFEKAGVSFTDVNGQIRPFYDLLIDLNKVWGTLDKNTQNYIATASAGANQRNRFLAIMENFNRVQQIHNELLDADGTLTQGYGVYLDSVEASMNRLKNTMQTGFTNFMESDTLKNLIEGANAVLDLALNHEVLGNSIANLTLKMGVLMALMNQMGKAMGTDYKGSILEVFMSTKSLTEAIQEAGGVANLFDATLEALGWTSKKTGESATTMSFGIDGLTKSMIVAKVEAIALQAVLSLGLALGIQLIIKLLGFLKDKIFMSTKDIEALNREVTNNIQTNKQNINALSGMAEEFEKLQGKVDQYGSAIGMTTEEQNRYYEISGMIAELAPEMVSTYDEQNNALLKYGSSIEKVIKQQEDLIAIEEQKILDQEGSINRNTFWSNVFTGADQALVSDRIDYTTKQLEDLERQMENVKKAGLTDDALAKDIRDKRVQLAELNGEYKKYNAQLQANAQKRQPLIDIYLKEAKAIEGINKETMDLFQNQINNMASDPQMTGSKIKDFIYQTTDGIESYKEAIDSMDVERIAQETEVFTQALIDNGMSAEQAQTFIANLASSMGFLAEITELINTSFVVNTESIKGSINEVNKMDELFRKVAQGQRLSANETIDLMTQYEELGEVVAENGEINVNSLSQIAELREKLVTNTQAEIKGQMEKARLDKEELTRLKEKSEFQLRAIEKAGGKSSIFYANVKKNVDDFNNRIKNIDSSYSKMTNQLKAMSLMSNKVLDKDNMENYAQATKSANTELKDLEGILKEVNKEGYISQEVAMQIIEKYPELMAYLGDEVTLREKIKEKIEELTQTQDDNFRNMLMMTESFSNAFYNKHSSLMNDVAKIYNIDLQNFKSVHDAKMALMGAMNGAITASGQAYAESMGGGAKGMLASYKALKESKTLPTSSGGGAGLTFIKGGKDMELPEIDKQIAYLQAQVDMAESFKAPKLSSFKPKSSGSKKSGSKSTKQVIEEVELLTDRYLKFEKALSKVTRSMQLNDGLMEYASGEDRIKVMEKANALLREQQRLLALQNKEARKEMSETEARLKKFKIDTNDGTWGIDSFATYTKQTEKAINGVIAQINKTSNDSLRENLTKQKDEMQKTYDKVKKDFDTYVELKESIPNRGAEWWVLEYEALSIALESIDAKYQEYDERVSYINDAMANMILIRDDNLDELEMEKGLLQDIANLHKDALNDVKKQVQASENMVKSLEAELTSLGDKRSTQYESISRRLIIARAELDKYYENYRIQLNALGSQQKAIMDRYEADLDRAKTKTLKAIEDIRESIKQFDEFGFENSLSKVLADLDKIDDIFVKNAEPTLSTQDTRRDIKRWRQDILEGVRELQFLEEDIEMTYKRQANSKEEIEKKQQKLVDLTTEQAKKERELKGISESLGKDILYLELKHKEIESALQNQIDLQQDELSNLQEKHKLEDKIRSIKEKQLEVMRAMDDTRYTYITGKGESVFTYDQEKVLALQKELAEMNRQDARETEIEKASKNITRMQEELARTREINKQELEVLKVAQKGINELIGIASSNIDESKATIEKSYSDLGTLFLDGLKAEMQSYTENYENYWDDKISRMTADIVQSQREINKGKLGGSANETFNAKNSEGYNYSKAMKGGSSGQALTVYSAKDGETIESIAKGLNATVEEIMRLNYAIKSTTENVGGKNLTVPDRFDTGGYTGSWNGSPRVALVDQKELILNSKDTENMLKAIEEVRRMSTVPFTNNKNESGSMPSINMYNPLFQEIHDVNDFASGMSKMARDGLGRLK